MNENQTPGRHSVEFPSLPSTPPQDAPVQPAPVPATPVPAAPGSTGGARRPEWGRRPEGDEDGWEQLSAKNLLLGPLSAIRSMLVPLIAIAVGSSAWGSLWSTLPLVGIALLGALLGTVPWYTQRFRVTDTQLQYRKGLFNRTLMTAPLDRIRSVDLEAKLLHRLLGLRTVHIGTGVDDDRIELNGMDAPRAEQLRDHLLHRRRPSEAGLATGATHAPEPGEQAPHVTPAATPAEPSHPARVLAEIDWTWIRFAPFDLTRLALVAAALGAIVQLTGQDLVPESTWSDVDDRMHGLLELGVTALVVIGVLAAVIGWIMVAVIGYVIQWWGLRLGSAHGSLQMSHGLLSTRSISVEEKRVRGVRISEPLLLRPVHGANLFTLATGVGSGGSTRILPQAPTDVVRHVGGEVLRTHTPVTLPLLPHGSAARRRSHVRQQWSTLTLLTVGLAGHTAFTHWVDVDAQLWWFLVPGALWLLVAPVLAELAYRHLGHALTEAHLVVGGGTTTRTRTVLEVDGVIGWVVERSWFQRRVGLCTLVATTAAGEEKVTLPDVEERVAVALMAQVTPEAVAPFAA